MKMTVIEKHFVNSPEHTLQVARRAQQLLDRIEIQAGGKYLDVGCGTGAAARAIANRYELDVTGVDVDPKQIEEAHGKDVSPRLHFQVMNASKLQFSDAEFDIVATSMVTHHMPNWEQAFSEMVRILRKGGYLFYTDLMFPPWLSVVCPFLHPFVGLPSTKRLESLASRAGLTEIHQSHSGLQYSFILEKKKETIS